jgi:hypothetical protein
MRKKVRAAAIGTRQHVAANAPNCIAVSAWEAGGALSGPAMCDCWIAVYRYLEVVPNSVSMAAHGTYKGPSRTPAE